MLCVPYNLKCCHKLFCKECLFAWLDKNLSCPICRKKVKKKDAEHCLIVERWINDLKAACPYCQCETTRGSLQDHIALCEAAPKIKITKKEEEGGQRDTEPTELVMLKELGVDHDVAIEALRACNNDVEKAYHWVSSGHKKKKPATRKTRGRRRKKK